MHPMDCRELIHLFSDISHLSIIEDMDINLCQNHRLPNILKLRPRLGDDILWKQIITSAEHSNFEAIFLCEDHVDQNVVSYHHKRHE